MLEKLNRVNYLFDFYGQLLTKKQQSIMEMYYKENFSLAEVAGHFNVSRQAVHDTLSRAVRTLEKWEKKLKLYENYLLRREAGLKALDLLSKERLDSEEINELRKIVKLFMNES
ncbi:MAG: YlxM family DNA-binding protein [Firmicutes bacterium]|nr:YlxM family DNA-binding protein [Bacillota bacterium]